MNKMTETPVERGIAYQGKFLDVRLDKVRLPNGRESVREYLLHPGSVAAVPLLGDGRVVLVKQFRYPVGQEVLEIPAGKIDPGEAPETAIYRELTEEIGYAAGQLTALISIWTSPGFCNELLHLFLATDLTRKPATGDEDEFIEVVAMTRQELLKSMHSGQIVDGKTLLAISYLENNNLW